MSEYQEMIQTVARIQGKLARMGIDAGKECATIILKLDELEQLNNQLTKENEA